MTEIGKLRQRISRINQPAFAIRQQKVVLFAKERIVLFGAVVIDEQVVHTVVVEVANHEIP